MAYVSLSRYQLALAVVLILVFGLPGFAQLPQLSDRARVVANEWLLSNCDTGEGSRLISQLTQFKAELEPYFLAVVQQGPDEKQLADQQKASEARFQQRQNLLSSDRRMGLTDDQRKAAQAVTREQYIAQEREDFVLRYKSQAVAGLGIVGGPKSKASLDQLSKDDKSPLKTSAQEALKQMARSKR